MKTIVLDVHSRRTQMCVSEDSGEVILEKVIETTAESLRREVSAIAGPKRVVFENGPLSRLIQDAVGSVAEDGEGP